MTSDLILVTGAGGFIGGHLVKALRKEKCGPIRAVDIKPLVEWWQIFDDVENLKLDLSDLDSCRIACDQAQEIYNLAADMGGIGFIENNKAKCMLSVRINTHLLLAASTKGVKRFFYSSSACVYNIDKQESANVQPLKEGDAYPALPEDGYGWEKLFSERMCNHFWEDFGIETRVARFHNVYGPFGTWKGGREKAPASICRKIIEAKESGIHEIEIWGDGEQTRTFMYIEDCIKGVQMIMGSNLHEPINLGSSELVTINQLVNWVENIADIRVRRRYNFDAPQGVKGRSSDNTAIRKELDWEPSTSLQHGLEETYKWIYEDYRRHHGHRI